MSGELYGPEDRIALLNNTNLRSHVVGSSSAWLVEFYSSWCGHCIHFAPTFKSLAADVYGWRDVISVGAIDCAQDYNNDICREYEVMGYPSLKFFKPQSDKTSIGEEQRKRDLSQEGIKYEMLDFVAEIQKNQSHLTTSWPNLQTFSSRKLEDIWLDATESHALILVDDGSSHLAAQVMMDVHNSIRKLKIPLLVRRTVNHLNLDYLPKLKTGSGILTLDKESTGLQQLAVDGDNREIWYSAIKDYIWANSKVFALTGKKEDSKKETASKALKSSGGGRTEKVASKKELINRRYKVYLSDLERAMIYSISHEVSQHSAIAGEALVALQKYITVLDKYFPSRPEVEVFLQELHAWVHQHEDVVRGEDLSKWIGRFTGDHGVQTNDKWMGCQGSKTMYGGYPCGLWSVWHALTVSQAKVGTGDPKEVLLAMQGFIQEFFGCRECARHFDQTIQQGAGIKEHVATYKDAVLYLWNIHNKVNLRLQGDISEDPVFPKQVFPSREFCSRCYTDMTGSNLWDEFDRDEVYKFLNNQFSMDKISHTGIPSDQVGGMEFEEHGVAVIHSARIEEELEQLDLDNYRKPAGGGMNLIFFNSADISLCLFLWISSALLIVLLYLKFVLKKKFSNTAILALLRRKTTMNPLAGKV